MGEVNKDQIWNAVIQWDRFRFRGGENLRGKVVKEL